MRNGFYRLFEHFVNDIDDLLGFLTTLLLLVCWQGSMIYDPMLLYYYMWLFLRGNLNFISFPTA